MKLAGAEGIEPPIKVLETSVIPLHHAPLDSLRLIDYMTVLEF